MRWLNGNGTEWRDGDTLVSIGFLEPLNAIMAAGALMADSYREDGELSLGEVVGSSASATIQAVLAITTARTAFTVEVIAFVPTAAHAACEVLPRIIIVT